MSSTDAQPTLLPGVSARTWQLVLQIIVWVATAATVFLLVANFVNGGRGFDFAYFIPMIAAYVLAYVAVFVSSARGKKEIAAGYTTLRRGNPTLPQLDAKTGEVLRKPGEPYLARHTRRDASATGYSLPVVGATPRPSPWARLRSTWYFLLIAAVATVGIFGRSGWLNPQGVVWLPVVFVSFVAFFALIFLIIGLVRRGRLAQLRAAAPGDLVFLISRSKALWPALTAVGWTLGELPSATALGVSADTQGLKVWRTGPATTGVILPWSSVTSVQADRMPVGNQSFPGVLVTLKAPDGDLVALPFVSAHMESFPIASKAEVAYIVAQLEQLRTSSTTARLI